ncbi:MAG: glycosyltransferase [Anaerovoracaceae bacterium]
MEKGEALMDSTQLLIMISTYNGKSSISDVINEVRYVLKRENISCQFLLVDDGSRDGSQEVLLQIGSHDSDVSVLCYDKNVGQQENIRRGLRGIQGEPLIVLTMDDDGQHPPEVIPVLVHKAMEGYDMVYGIPEWTKESRPPFIRRYGSRLRDIFFRKAFRLPKGVKVSAYRVMTGNLARRLSVSNRNFFYLSAEALQANIRVANIPYPYVPRKTGKSSYSIWKLACLYTKIWYYYRWKKN